MQARRDEAHEAEHARQRRFPRVDARDYAAHYPLVAPEPLAHYSEAADRLAHWVAA